MINTVKRVEREYGTTAESDAEAFKTLYDAEECGYNKYIVMQGKTLKSICKNDNTFEQDFAEYLKAFDDVLKQLLGIEREKTDQKFLNMDGIVAELRKKYTFRCLPSVRLIQYSPKSTWAYSPKGSSGSFS